MALDQVRVGVGLFIIRGSKTLLGQRRLSHGLGEYGGVGGHLEHLETFEQAALRELSEEAGDEIRVGPTRFLCLTNLRRYRPKHYVDIGLVADWVSGNPRVAEPDKLESWGWFPLDDLPGPLFGTIQNYVEAYKSGRVYFQMD